MVVTKVTYTTTSDSNLTKNPTNGESRVSFFLPDDPSSSPNSPSKNRNSNSSTPSTPTLLAPPSDNRYQSRGSIFDQTNWLKKRASQIILEVPAAHLRKINETESISSIKRESKHFSDNTTLHGPKRIYYGKKCSFVFWIVMMFTSMILLVTQVVTLGSMYASHPTVSQNSLCDMLLFLLWNQFILFTHYAIREEYDHNTDLCLPYYISSNLRAGTVSFLIKDDGIEFPMITLCNFNPIKKTYIKKLNKTGDFSDDLLDYLMEFLIDPNTLYGTADRETLHVGRQIMFEAGLASILEYAAVILDMQGSGKDWMQKQLEAGVTAGCVF
ncbi:unnamed protein product [Cylicostephanus goldi]|uniref:Ion transport domain-containing protein n=1 Tax=Cylicostephanus goldi TaxID=71465 RepID=A0A3P6RZE5_CYLGO|nr:unnamed protein product [Cylicostephanus goldi]